MDESVELAKWIENVERRKERTENIDPTKPQRVCKIYKLNSPDVNLEKIFAVADEIVMTKQKGKFILKVYIDGYLAGNGKRGLIERILSRFGL